MTFRGAAFSVMGLLASVANGACSTTQPDAPRPLPRHAACPDIVTIFIPVVPKANGVWVGVTWVNQETGIATSLDLDPTLATNPTWAKNVCTHEVGHVLGVEHGGIPGDAMWATVSTTTLVTGLTRMEAFQAMTESEGRAYVLEIPPTIHSEVVAALGFACGIWNLELGREAVTVDVR